MFKTFIPRGGPDGFRVTVSKLYLGGEPKFEFQNANVNHPFFKISKTFVLGCWVGGCMYLVRRSCSL